MSESVRRKVATLYLDGLRNTFSNRSLVSCRRIHLWKMIETQKFYARWKFEFLLVTKTLRNPPNKKVLQPIPPLITLKSEESVDHGYPKETGACDEINTVIQSKG